MRRSFGGAMGGGNGGGLMRTAHRAVISGEPFSPSTANSTKKNPNFNQKTSNSSNAGLALNNGFSSVVNLPPSATPCCEDLEWEFVADETLSYKDCLFSTVPSTHEVHHAVSALQQFLGSSTNAGAPGEDYARDSCKDFAADVMSPRSCKSVSSVESQMDWLEPTVHLCDSAALERRGPDRAYDAFHLLQTNPSVQRMVISLSSDKAVWDAILNNEVVREVRGSIQADEKIGAKEVTEEGSCCDNSISVMSWILKKAGEKMMHLIDKITKLVNEMLQPANEKRGGTTDPLEEVLTTSLFLSVFVLLIVVVTRAKSA